MLLYLVCFLTAAALLAADQMTKFWVETHMVLEEVRPLLPPVLELHAVHNYGAAWSLFAGARWVLVGVTAAMMLAVAAVLLLRLVRHPLGVFSAFLILSGGVGNLLDRIFQGYVVDMLRFPFWTSYPTFNVADVCVVTGCVLWLLYVLFVREDQAKPEGTAVQVPSAEGQAEPGNTAESGGGAEMVPVSVPENVPESVPGNAPETAPESGKAEPIYPERPPVDPALLGGSPWKTMFQEEETWDGAFDEEEDDALSGDGQGEAGEAGAEAGEVGEETGETDEKTGEADEVRGEPNKETEEADKGDKAEGESEETEEDWDSAENFFGASPSWASAEDGRA